VTESGLLVALLLAGGAACAAKQSSHSYIVKDSSGPVEVAVEPHKPRLRLAPGVLQAARAEALKRRAADEPKPLPTIEGTDRRLRDALAAVQEAPTSANHVRAAQEYFRVQVFDRSLEQYDLALEKTPASAAALDGRARVWRDMGLLAFALADAQRAKFHAPHDAAVRNTLATIHQALGQYDFARAEFREAVRLDPSAEYSRRNLDWLERTHGMGPPPK
jgi:tetratricopeptide (TPR) repeat protein